MSRFSRTGWKCIPTSSMIKAMLPDAMVYQKDLDDGVLQVIVGPEPTGFHLSISHTGWSEQLVPGTSIRKRKLTRYPSWDEIISARNEFCPRKMTLAMVLPPKEEYVNLHDTTFHLWEVAGDMPAARGVVPISSTQSS